MGPAEELALPTPPNLVRSATRMFDDAPLTAYEKLAPFDPMTGSQKAQCRLPLRLGGRGLRGRNASPMSRNAPVWSKHNAASTLPAPTPASRKDDDNEALA